MHDRFFIPPVATEQYKQLPKCNLHTHLEGSVRPDTFLDLADAQNIALPFDRSDIKNHIQINGEEKNLVDYLNKIMVNYQILKSPAALRRVAFEAAEAAYFDGVIYFELRAGPVTHSTPEIPVELCIESMLQGLKEAEEKYGIICRLIVAGLRDHAPDTNRDLARVALRYRDEGVVGFDLAGDELGYPVALHKEALELIRGSGMGITIHAGEADGWKSVHNAVEGFEAMRIGHGVRSIESPRMIAILQEKQVLLEVCPTSNVHTGTFPNIEDHPVKKLFDAGIPVSIGDDDPITSRTLVSNELTLIDQVLGFSFDEIVTTQLMSVEHSFLNDERLKTQLQAKIIDFTP